MDLRERGWGDVDWINLAQGRANSVNASEHDNENSVCMQLEEIFIIWERVILSRRILFCGVN
jgi:hypothetical protein